MQKKVSLFVLSSLVFVNCLQAASKSAADLKREEEQKAKKELLAKSAAHDKAMTALLGGKQSLQVDLKRSEFYSAREVQPNATGAIVKASIMITKKTLAVNVEATYAPLADRTTARPACIVKLRTTNEVVVGIITNGGFCTSIQGGTIEASTAPVTLRGSGSFELTKGKPVDLVVVLWAGNKAADAYAWRTVPELEKELGIDGAAGWIRARMANETARELGANPILLSPIYAWPTTPEVYGGN